MVAAPRGPITVLAVTVVVCFAAWMAWFIGGHTFADAFDSYLLSNTALGVTFTAFGVLVLAHRPKHTVGRLFIAFGACYAASVACLGLVSGALPLSAGVERWITVVGITVWIPAPLVVLPLILQLFPDGRPLSSRWRPFVAVTLALTATAPLLALAPGSIEDEPITDPSPLLPARAGEVVQAVLPFFTALAAATLLVSLGSLALRARRSIGVERLQVMWLLWAVAVFVVLNAQRLVTTDGPILFVLTLALIPAAGTVAIVRYHLYDIRLIVNRSAVYGILTGGVVLAYLSLVAVTAALVGDHTRAGALLATGLVAVAFAPARARVQARVDRLMYGRRRDPAQAAATVVVRLGDGLDGVLRATCEALALPYAAVSSNGRIVASHGVLPDLRHTFALDAPEGSGADLLVGLRVGETRLSGSDERALDLLRAPISVAWQAMVLSEDLLDSRARIVASREEERRRLRRDLHDALGGSLTAVSLKVDAALNLRMTDPGGSAELLTGVRADLTGVIDDIRRLVNALRPQPLDDLGLVGALRQRADHAWSREDGTFLVTIDAPEPMPAMPAAVEVAAYRIASEAVTNTMRHAQARRCAITMRVDGDLYLEVRDDGADCTKPWQVGVGLTSMAERATELGGRLVAGPTDHGGRVHAVLPLEPA